MRGLFAAAVALWMTLFGAAYAAPPASAYGSLPAILDAAISPDGNRIAILREHAGTYVLEVDDLFTMSSISAQQPAEGVTFRGVAWGNNDFVLVRASVTFNPNKGKTMLESNIPTSDPDKIRQYEYNRLLSFPAVGGPGKPLLHYVLYTSNLLNLTRYWPETKDMPGKIRMSLINYAAGVVTVQKVDLESGANTSIFLGTQNTEDFIINPAGEVVGRVDTERTNGVQKLYAKQPGGGFKEILRPSRDRNEYEDANVASSTLADGRFVMWGLNEAGTANVIYALDPVTGVKTQISDLAGNFIHEPATGEIVGVTLSGEFPAERYFPEDLIAVQAALEAKFRQGYASLVSWDRARNIFVVKGENAGSPASYYVYNAKQKTLSALSSTYPAVDPASYGQRLALKYKARDGKSIPAYLTLPPGAQGPAKYPAVVLVHGGPAARDTFAYDWWASFLASRGYAVLQPNYRGSWGYGDEWEEAGYRQWGGLMQNDVTDGVNAMVKAGYFDAQRVCIAGASYGGYAALAGATMTPDLYRCAVSVAGVTNLVTLMDRDAERYGPQSMRADADFKTMGDRKTPEGRDQLRSISPVSLAGQDKASILLLHGPQDTVVPIEQSLEMQKALIAARKPVRLIELKGDDHWLSYGATRTQVLEEMDKFLAENLK